ncbi:MAG: hypothetical protein WCJ64_08760 [Rhodospirillaceae bacterium]
MAASAGIVLKDGTSLPAAVAAASILCKDPTTLAVGHVNSSGIFTAFAAAGLFYKTDPYAVAFTKTGNGSVSIKAGAKIELNGTVFQFSADTAVTMPSLSAGTDYAIYMCADGSIRADANFTAPTGYTASNSRQVGGFHYGLANLNVNSTVSINAFSLWDIKWRPTCLDPRGMALVGGWFWADIYLLGINHVSVGTSATGQTIADGASPPKIPLLYGGSGSASYSDLTWWTAAEVLSAYGKKLPSYQEFCALAYGVTENQSVGSDPGTTQHQAGYTSAWGIEQATGVLWQWSRDFGGPYAAASWSNTNGGRGQVYNQPNVAILGGYWTDGANAGSRASTWINAPSSSSSVIGARGHCDHMRLV